MMKRAFIGLAVIVSIGAWWGILRGPSLATQTRTAPFSVRYLEPTTEQRSRAYSPAVITEGGKLIWLAGQNGGGAPGNFSAQAKSVFDQLQATLGRSGASL